MPTVTHTFASPPQTGKTTMMIGILREVQRAVADASVCLVVDSIEQARWMRSHRSPGPIAVLSVQQFLMVPTEYRAIGLDVSVGSLCKRFGDLTLEEITLNRLSASQGPTQLLVALNH